MMSNPKDYNRPCLPRCLGVGPVNLLAQTVSEHNNKARRQVMIKINLLMILTAMEINVHVCTHSPAAVPVNRSLQVNNTLQGLKSTGGLEQAR